MPYPERFVRRVGWYSADMPSDLTRRSTTSGFHFITTSCYRRMPLFNTIPFRNLFLRELEKVRQGYEFVIVGYVGESG
ncbi:MAG: hypothetical protein ABI383_01650, partial [Acidobacteriaceae bacterium]